MGQITDFDALIRRYESLHSTKFVHINKAYTFRPDNGMSTYVVFLKFIFKLDFCIFASIYFQFKKDSIFVKAFLSGIDTTGLLSIMEPMFLTISTDTK